MDLEPPAIIDPRPARTLRWRVLVLVAAQRMRSDFSSYTVVAGIAVTMICTEKTGWSLFWSNSSGNRQGTPAAV